MEEEAVATLTQLIQEEKGLNENKNKENKSKTNLGKKGGGIPIEELESFVPMQQMNVGQEASGKQPGSNLAQEIISNYLVLVDTKQIVTAK